MIKGHCLFVHCKLCKGQKFVSVGQLNFHYARYHNNKDITCIFCHKIYKNDGKIMRHYLDIHKQTLKENEEYQRYIKKYSMTKKLDSKDRTLFTATVQVVGCLDKDIDSNQDQDQDIDSNQDQHQDSDSDSDSDSDDSNSVSTTASMKSLANKQC